MNYLDADTTNTDWSEFEQPKETECCQITGVSRALHYGPAGFSGDELTDSCVERGGRSNSKLQAMFDKFLYQK